MLAQRKHRDGFHTAVPPYLPDFSNRVTLLISSGVPFLTISLSSLHYPGLAMETNLISTLSLIADYIYCEYVKDDRPKWSICQLYPFQFIQLLDKLLAF